MKKYNLSDNEKDYLKVAKLNHDISLDAISSLSNNHSIIDNDIESNERFLSEIERKLNIDSSNICVDIDEYSVQPRQTNWDTLITEANQKYPKDIMFDDILNSSDFLNAYNHLEEINEKFRIQTGLNKTDIILLITATALQCTRQYVIDPWIKNMRPASSSNDEGKRKGNAERGWYYVKTESILKNRVPFDCDKYADNSTIQGFLKGTKNHRMATLGHDPMLGWVFGTANIMTNTITRRDFQSAHVKNVGGRNKIYAKADTAHIFESVYDRVTNEGSDGKLALGAALLREFIHLKSDVNTKLSLPLPGVTVVSAQLADTLSKYGIDTASVSTEIGISAFINIIISMIHRLTYDNTIDKKLFEVRTRKILLYSNCIASTSNAIITHLKKDPSMLDVGGMIVTIIELFRDLRFITKVKEDFINNELQISFKGITEELDIMYRTIYQ